ncbi:MAG TPA: hypothetical protein VNE63_18090 [Candidatus Acidoferrales bacterium]|nr:hypothetical protein [Candidatus Acidoferrales bacterium]
MTRTIKWLSFILFLSALFGAGAQAQTITAASCNTTDVQAAFNSVVSSTTTVNIPAGTCDWTTQVTLTVPSGSSSLSILGAGNLGVTGGGDATVIVDDFASTSALLSISTGSASSHFRLAGITVEGGTGNSAKDNGIVAIDGDSQNLRLDHCHFNGNTYTGGATFVIVKFSGWIYGVVDHSVFDSGSSVTVWMDSYNNDSFGDGSWADNTNFSGSNFLFIENNIFSGLLSGNGTYASYVDDCSMGGRLVIRYNTMNDTGVQTHPTGGSGRIRGCRAQEIYNNTLNGSNSTPTFTAFFDSSGTALVWGNSAPVGFESLIDMLSMRRDNSAYSQTAAPNGWGYCGTSFNGTGSAWDENTVTTSGYACIDQPGQGKSDLLSGDFPNAVDTVTSTLTWPHQNLEPNYEWLDTWNPVPGYSRPEIGTSDSSVLAANRDYYQYTSSFNGTSGTGSGLLSARPSTCTPLVAYWATDTQTLYQCATTNTWSVYYKPYVYPHPLDVTSSATAPAAPANPVAVAY